jgi:hypothetical protein
VVRGVEFSIVPGVEHEWRLADDSRVAKTWPDRIDFRQPGCRRRSRPWWACRVGKITSKTLAIEKLVTGDGHRLPPRLAAEITREMQRLATVEQQIDAIEKERDTAPTTCKETEKKRHLLLQLKEGAILSARVTAKAR